MSVPWNQLPAVTGGSRIVLGGRFGEEPEPATHRRLNLFTDAGGRLVDTAHSYADGESERVLGRWLRTRGRDRVALIDKVCHPRNGRRDARPATIHAEIDESLSRLRTDRIDVVLLHRDDPAVSVEDIAAARVAEIDRGRARCVGVSNWPWSRLRQFLDVIGAIGHSPVVSYQRSLAFPVREIWPGALTITDDWAATLSNTGTPLLAWAAQARGWFAGADDATTGESPFSTVGNVELRWLAAEIGHSHGVPATVVALAWLLRHHLVWPIVGPAKDTELMDSLRAARLDLTAEEARALDSARRSGPVHDLSR